MLHEQHRHAQLGVDAAKEADHPVDLFMADAAGRLVQKQKARFGDEGTRELDAFLRAEGKGCDGKARQL